MGILHLELIVKKKSNNVGNANRKEKKMNKNNWRLAPWQDYPEDDDVNSEWDADWDDVIDPSDPPEERK